MKKTIIQEIIETTEISPLRESVIGWISDLDLDKEIIRVNYPSNSLNTDLVARLGNWEIDLNTLQQALLRKAEVQLEFINNQSDQPIIREIFFSPFAEVADESEGLSDKTLHFKAARIVLEGTEEVIIKSGSAKTTYQSEGGKLTSEGKKLKSSASGNHRIRGGAVLLN